ncbi:alpha/beta hydrolase [Rhizobium jaguaris]|uniref:Alpha/beta hydrolase n=1 Tax=Rhizobium jaguaris TaxID=1312183 RepID=A0A387G458_9HYPH|nr:alpha/beta hydrolase [Rhizobium jaguaris]AYG63074.1 alpha/beta hydrolase [Rhizobium jaguaris]
MSYFRITDWESAYTSDAYVVGGDRWPAAWVEPARAFRDSLAKTERAELDLAYGLGARNRFDLFLPVEKPRGLVVFIHGGYWLELDKSYWSHLAAGPVANGYAVAIPSYTLCPDIRLAGIAKEIAAAIGKVADMVDGSVMLVGHSAGGQLATRMVTKTSPLAAPVQARIRHVVSISGVHDLRPIMKRAMNDHLRIDAAEAAAESPALLEPVENIRLTCWVGGAERAEFIRQTALLANIWTGLGAATNAVVDPDQNHFTVLDGLTDATHPLTRTLLSE